jgi:hypothetical protein
MYECKDGLCYIKSYVKECKNFIACENKVSDNNDDELCFECYHMFGKWRNKPRNSISVKSQRDFCPLCEENEEITVYRMDCDHHVCLNCFRKIYFGIEVSKPKFKINFTPEMLNEYNEQLEKWNKFRRVYNMEKFNSRCFECNN